MKKFLVATKLRYVVVGILLMFLVSCSDTSPEKIEKLRKGMSAEEAISTLGEPYTKEFRTDGCVLKYVYRVNGYRHSLYVYIENNQVTYWF